MTSKHFLLTSLATFLSGALIIVGSSYRIDAYGLFSHARHEQHTAYRGERTTKYLFSYNYVPSNFDGLLLGASISLNWNTKDIPSQRIYNGSISGANIFEEGLIAEQVMSRKKLKVLVLALHPYLTMTHGRRTEYMTPSEYWSALGSLSLFFFEASQALARRGIVSDDHNEYGDWNYSEGLSPSASRAAMERYIVERKRSGVPSHNFTVAPGAFQDLSAVFRRARSQGAEILVVYPPVYKARFEVEQADWEGYWSRVQTLFPPDTQVVNFNTPQFDALRSDITNFQDSGHLSRGCADAIVREINNQLGGNRSPASGADR